jgi:alpha-ribazole phosphatase
MPDFTRIYLIRHGEVVGSGPKRYNGHRDVDLNANGLAQMEQMAERLGEFPIVAVYCSDLVRTIKGAEILARLKKLPVHRRPALREKSFGAWEGLTYNEVAAKFPQDWEAWLADPAGARPTGGETFYEAEQRVLQELNLILKSHAGQEVVILSHGGTNRIILCHALRLDLKHVFRIEQKYAALNIIDFFDHGMATVQLMNG